MVRPDNQTSTAAIRAIHVAFVVAALVYIVIAYVIASDADPRPLPMPLTAILVAVAAASIAAGYILPRRFWARVEAGEVAGVRPGALAAYQTASIMAWTCYEVPAILGLVLAIITAQWVPALAGSVVALVFLVTTRPQLPNFG
jgi:hypothetical protein